MAGNHSFRNTDARAVADSPQVPSQIDSLLAALPKAELHLHLEGSIQPRTAVELAARHGIGITEREVALRYAPGNFNQFLDAFKWVTSFLRAPEEYALITGRLAEQLLAQNVVYAEVTLSIGVMLLRKQDALANFAAIQKAAAAFERRGLRMQWIFDAVRQFGISAAQEVVKLARQSVGNGVVAFGIGGDELALPAGNFRELYEQAAASGLGLVIHAGEIGDAGSVREAVELLGVTRIGHGIGAMRDRLVMDFLAERGVALEICPTSNLRTGALARQLGQPTASIEQHPLRLFFERGMQVALSTDDPAMFETTLLDEYRRAAEMGFSAESLVSLAEMSFQNAFLAAAEKERFLGAMRAARAAL